MTDSAETPDIVQTEINLEGAIARAKIAARSPFTPYLIIGDSHSYCYSLPQFAKYGLFPVCLTITGGSARGLSNPDSTLRGAQMIETFLANVPKWPTFFCFGQVDVEFTYYYSLIRERRHKEPFDRTRMNAFVDETVERYSGFLNGLMIDATTLGIFPTALRDDELRQGYFNAHIGVLNSLNLDTIKQLSAETSFPSERERVEIHRSFNEKLARATQSASMFDSLLRDGVLRDECHYNKAAHHLNANMFADELATFIRPLVLASS
jgi:hypothetical protein